MGDEARRWRMWLMQRMFQLASCVESENFDHVRYGAQPTEAEHLAERAAYLMDLNDNFQSYFSGRQLLATDASRDLFDQLLLYRVLGYQHVRLPMGNPEVLAGLKVPAGWLVKETMDAGELGKLCVFAVPVGGEVVTVKCWAANVEAFRAGQYYFNRDARIEPEPRDHVLDCGGCFGDTALFFAQRIGAGGRVYSFDPIPKHCELMRESFSMNGEIGNRIVVVPAGLADVDQDASMIDNQGIDPGARVDRDSGLALCRIDTVVERGEVARIDFIKMDIEGSELAALRGGEEAIRRWRPKLAISLYHRPEDFYTIPRWIHGLGLGYRMYLDHYSIHREETVLYASASG